MQAVYTILEVALTGLVYTGPFWLFRALYAKPMNRILGLLFTLFFTAVIHVAWQYIVFGYCVQSSTIPYLWTFVSAYFIIAQNPFFVPERKTNKKTDKKISDSDNANRSAIKEEKARLPLSNREKFLAIMVILLFAACLFLGYTAYNDKKTISDLSDKQVYYQAKITQLENNLEFANSLSAAARKKIDFFDNNIVFVGSGEKYYHRYSCYVWQEYSRFYAYNTENAKYLGYKPCDKCKPPQ